MVSSIHRAYTTIGLQAEPDDHFSRDSQARKARLQAAACRLPGGDVHKAASWIWNLKKRMLFDVKLVLTCRGRYRRSTSLVARLQGLFPFWPEAPPPYLIK